MNQNHNPRQNRQGRPNHNKPNQHHNQKRGKGRPNQNQNRNQQSNSPNRQMDSRGPAGGQRGTAKQLYEKYKTLAQEKRASDRLESESLNQHADHYYRIYAEFAATEAAAEAAREKDRARKNQEDAERRANAAAANEKPPVVEEQPKKTIERNTEQTVQNDKPAQNPRQNRDSIKLDLDVPKRKPRRAPVAVEAEAQLPLDVPKTDAPITDAPAADVAVKKPVKRRAPAKKVVSDSPKSEEASEQVAQAAPEPAEPKKRRGRPPKAKVVDELKTDTVDPS